MKPKTLGAIVFLVALAFVTYALYNYAVASPYRISADEARYKIADNQVDLILDVRTQFERDKLGFYPGSVHIPSADLEKRMSAEYANKDTHILVYCNTGHRARAATEKLRALGYKNVNYIATGYKSLMA